MRAIYPAFRVLSPNLVIRADELAEAMIDVAVRETGEHGGLVFENRDIRAMAKVEFGEDVAALANTSGGVLVVGVSDKTRLRTD